MPDSPPQKAQANTPAQPTKVFVWSMALTGWFYFVDCVVVTISQDHSDTPWIERGIYSYGVAGFWVTVLAFVCGIASWIREITRKEDEERNALSDKV